MPVKDKRYPVWWNMLQRCYNETATRYPSYGAVGITVDERWWNSDNGFQNFCDDMGPRPEGFTLDRINNHLGYSPGNCRWADYFTQNRNKDSVKIKESDVPKIFSMRDAKVRVPNIAKSFNVSISAIYYILRSRELYEARASGST